MSDFITVCKLLAEKGGYIRRPCHWYMFGIDEQKWEYGFITGDLGFHAYLVSDRMAIQPLPKDALFSPFRIAVSEYFANDWEHVG